MPRLGGKQDLSKIQIQERTKRRNRDLGRGHIHNPCASSNRRKGNKGNLPYLRFRRKMRKNMFGKVL